MSSSLAKHAQRALDLGLDYLVQVVREDGAWPSDLHLKLDLTDDPRPEYPPFVAGLGALSLAESAHPEAQGLYKNARTFLGRCMEYPGVWRYWSALPPDLDDTAVCSQIVGTHVWLALDRTLPTVFRKRDREGRFQTWFVKGDDSSTWDDIDSVVNANVIAWLGDRPETRPAQRWLKTLIDENLERGSSWYYPDPMDLYAALSRSRVHRSEEGWILSSIESTIISRIMSSYLNQLGHFGDVQRSVQAISALDRLDAWPGKNEVELVANYLLASQAAEGSWRSGLVWQGPPPPNPPSAGFTSDALITAYCVEALERIVRKI